jgi:hypothetical protein
MRHSPQAQVLSVGSGPGDVLAFGRESLPQQLRFDALKARPAAQ